MSFFEADPTATLQRRAKSSASWTSSARRSTELQFRETIAVKRDGQPKRRSLSMFSMLDQAEAERIPQEISHRIPSLAKSNARNGGKGLLSGRSVLPEIAGRGSSVRRGVLPVCGHEACKHDPGCSVGKARRRKPRQKRRPVIPKTLYGTMNRSMREAASRRMLLTTNQSLPGGQTFMQDGFKRSTVPLTFREVPASPRHGRAPTTASLRDETESERQRLGRHLEAALPSLDDAQRAASSRSESRARSQRRLLQAHRRERREHREEEERAREARALEHARSVRARMTRRQHEEARESARRAAAEAAFHRRRRKGPPAAQDPRDMVGRCERAVPTPGELRENAMRPVTLWEAEGPRGRERARGGRDAGGVGCERPSAEGRSAKANQRRADPRRRRAWPRAPPVRPTLRRPTLRPAGVRTGVRTGLHRRPRSRRRPSSAPGAGLARRLPRATASSRCASAGRPTTGLRRAR